MSELLHIDVFETKEELTEALGILKGYISRIEDKLEALETDINNHVYPNLLEAEYALMGSFERQAGQDCEGSYNCGNDIYTQEFIVDGVEYIGIGHFEYDRHDKTYYYVYSSRYEYKLLSEYNA